MKKIRKIDGANLDIDFCKLVGNRENVPGDRNIKVPLKEF